MLATAGAEAVRAARRASAQAALRRDAKREVMVLGEVGDGLVAEGIGDDRRDLSKTLI